MKPTATPSRDNPYTLSIDDRPKNKITVSWPEKNDTLGVGTPVVLKFTKTVPTRNRQNLADATTATACGSEVEGGWWWPSSTEARFRPLEYWPGPCPITLTVDTTNLNFGPNRAPRKNIVAQFNTTNAWTVTVDGRTQQMKVYKNGSKVKTVGVSMGKPGWRTRNGIKLIASHDYNYTMRGTAEDGPYELLVDYAMRVTDSGELIHSAPWANGRIGRWPGSHGCTNVTISDGKWLITHLPWGTPVKYTHTQGEDTDPSNGVGDWNVPDKDLYKVSAAPPVS